MSMSTATRRFPLLSLLVAILTVGSLMARATGAAALPVGPAETGGTPKPGGEWTVGVLEDPDTLDGHKAGYRVAGDIMRNVCDPLIAIDFEGKYGPGLATEWTISPDGLTWTFNLRQDVSFHDGTKFNAAAVKFNFDRILDPATNSAVASSLLGPGASTTVIDEYTFEYKLKQPFAPLLYDLTDFGFICMFSPDAVSAAGDDFGRKPVGTGPFMVDEWRSGDRIMLKRNPNYTWAPAYLNHQGPANIETLTFRVIIEEAARTAAFEAGEVDQLRVAPASDVSRFKESGEYHVVEYLAQSVQSLEFNVTKPPFDDVAVRRALNYASDKQAVVDASLEGFGIPAYGYLSPSMWGYWPGIEQYAPSYDPERAKTMLAEAGWTDTDGDGIIDKGGQPLSFVAYTLPLDIFTRAAQVLQSNFKNIGVEMEIQTFENATLIEKLQAGEPQADLLGYIYGEPDIAYLWFHSANIGGGLNFPHISDPKLDEMIVAGRSTTDLTERAKIYEELQRYLSDLAVWVPLWVPQTVDVFAKRIHNATFHPSGYTIYTAAWVD